MKSDWDEIRQLAVDLHKSQSISAVQKLSDKNCVEILSKLIELQLVDVVFTTTGKQYVTQTRLTTEIHEELSVNNGLISLDLLAENLEISYNVIVARVLEICQESASIYSKNGYLFNEKFLDSVAADINERVQQFGCVELHALLIHYDLPIDFLISEMHSRLGTIIEAEMDQQSTRTRLYTSAYKQRSHAIIRGALSAAFQPVPLSRLLARYQLTESILYDTVIQLIKAGRLNGHLSGSDITSSTFIPALYTEAQLDFIRRHISSFKCIEHSVLDNIGIRNAKSFLSKKFPTLITFDHFSVCESLVSLLKCELQACIDAHTISDISTWFSGFDMQNIHTCLLYLKQTFDTLNDLIVFQSFAIPGFIIQHLIDHFSASISEVAAKYITDGRYPPSDLLQHSVELNVSTKCERKEERQKKAKAACKTGGGFHGRESKTRAVKTKNKLVLRRESDSASMTNDEQVYEFMSKCDLQQNISRQKMFENTSEDLVDFVVEFLYNDLNVSLEKKLKEIYSEKQNSHTQVLRSKFSEFNEYLSQQYVQIRLFAKSINFFDEDVRVQLTKYLCRTLCTDLLNCVCSHYVCMRQISVNKSSAEYTADIRARIFNNLESDEAKVLREFSSTLQKCVTPDELIENNGSLCAVMQLCDVYVHKIDRKKERMVTHDNRCLLMEQLKTVVDLPLALHLATLILFNFYFGCMLHASGKFVPSIIKKLSEKMSQSEDIQFLYDMQSCVLANFKQKDSVDFYSSNDENVIRLKTLVSKICD